MKKIFLIYFCLFLCMNLYARQIIIEPCIGGGNKKVYTGFIIQDFIIHSSLALPSVEVGAYFKNGFLHNKMLIGLSCYQDLINNNIFNISIYSSLKIGITSAEMFMIAPSIGMNISIYHLNFSSQLNFYQKDFSFKEDLFRKDIIFAVGILY